MQANEQSPAPQLTFAAAATLDAFVCAADNPVADELGVTLREFGAVHALEGQHGLDPDLGDEGDPASAWLEPVDGIAPEAWTVEL